MQLSDVVLLESKTARNAQLVNLSHDTSREILNKVKGLIFALWEGTGRATTNQIAEFYDVSIDVIKKVHERHRDELAEDGVKTLRGKQLKEVNSLFQLSRNTPNLTLWTPCAALRLSLYLRDSDVAARVRQEWLGISDYASTITFKETHIERAFTKISGGQRQQRLKSKRRIDIQESVALVEVKRGTVTARHVGQLFEYLHETDIHEGKLIGVSFSSCAAELVRALKRIGYSISLITYHR